MMTKILPLFLIFFGAILLLCKADRPALTIKGYEDVDMDKFKHGVMPEFWENIMNYILANSTNTEFLFRYGGDEHEVLKLEAILRDDPSQLKFSGDGPNVLKIQNQHSIAQLFKNLIKYYKLMSDEVCIAYRQFEDKNFIGQGLATILREFNSLSENRRYVLSRVFSFLHRIYHAEDTTKIGSKALASMIDPCFCIVNNTNQNDVRFVDSQKYPILKYLIESWNLFLTLVNGQLQHQKRNIIPADNLSEFFSFGTPAFIKKIVQYLMEKCIQLDNFFALKGDKSEVNAAKERVNQGINYFDGMKTNSVIHLFRKFVKKSKAMSEVLCSAIRPVEKPTLKRSICNIFDVMNDIEPEANRNLLAIVFDLLHASIGKTGNSKDESLRLAKSLDETLCTTSKDVDVTNELNVASSQDFCVFRHMIEEWNGAVALGPKHTFIYRMVFGVDLDYLWRNGEPEFLKSVSAHMKAHCTMQKTFLSAEGNTPEVDQLQEQVNRGNYDFSHVKNHNSVVSLFKRFLRSFVLIDPNVCEKIRTFRDDNIRGVNVEEIVNILNRGDLYKRLLINVLLDNIQDNYKYENTRANAVVMGTRIDGILCPAEGILKDAHGNLVKTTHPIFARMIQHVRFNSNNKFVYTV